jgi:hypothetical protein
MKMLLAMLVLTVSVGAIAQVEITQMLDKKEIGINSDSAILIRTSTTPEKVTLTMQVPMASSVCEDPRSEYILRTCHRSEQVYRTQEVCRNVTTTTPSTTPSTPRGPRYNGTNPSGSNTTTTTRRVCTQDRVYVGTRTVAYDCSYYNNYCAHWGTNVNRESDKVKIKFKDLPTLGGSEQETFRIKAKQRSKDGENVVYDITILSTVEGREYEVESKGILGFDSYVIKTK